MMKMQETGVIRRYLVIAAFVVGALVSVGYVAMEVQIYYEKARRAKNNNEFLHVLPVGNF
jgi:hypothetical protein